MTSQRIGLVLVGALGLAIGVLGTKLASSDVRANHVAPGAQEAPGAVSQSPVDSSLLRAEIAGAVRSEVRRALAEAPTRAAEASPALPPERTAEQEAARVRSAEVIESAVRAGRWTDADRHALLTALPHLTREETEQTLRALARAINAGELEVTTLRGPI